MGGPNHNSATPMTVDVDCIIPVSEANAMGVSKLARRAEAGEKLLLVRGGKPVAWIVGARAEFNPDYAEDPA